MKNDQPKGTPPAPALMIYATRITSRHPAQWKLHGSLRAARGALSVRRWYGYGELWELEDGSWKLIEERSYGR